MAAQLVPQLLSRARTVRATLAACTAAGGRPSLRSELTRTSTMLLTWSLEDSLERSDAMRARGWESGEPRTRYRPERLRASDVAVLAAVGALVALAAAGAWVACSAWRFYPRMSGPGPWWAYVPWALLAATPAACEVVARLVERRLP